MRVDSSAAIWKVSISRSTSPCESWQYRIDLRSSAQFVCIPLHIFLYSVFSERQQNPGKGLELLTALLLVTANQALTKRGQAKPAIPTCILCCCRHALQRHWHAGPQLLLYTSWLWLFGIA